MPDLDQLILVFEDVRRRLQGADLSWSSWADRESAGKEIDAVLAGLRGGSIPPGVSALFLPTGPIQEVAASSGWGDEFLELADRFDRALRSCSCLENPVKKLVDERHLGMDRQYAEVSVLRCPDCGRHWLRYFYEMEWISRSGRWFHGVITDEQAATLTADDGQATLAALDWYFYGGSYYDGVTGKAKGPLEAP